MAEILPPAPPPNALPELRTRDVRRLAQGTRIWRIYFRGGERPAEWNRFRFFGPVRRGRFDHHLLPRRTQSRGVVYGVPALGRRRDAMLTCVAETFQEDRTIDPSRRDPWLVGFALAASVTLLDVTSGWTTRAGGNQAICSGDRRRAQGWARAAYERYVDVQGIFYATSTFGPGRAAALFERAADAIPPRPVFHRPLKDPGLRGFLEHAASDLDYELLA